MFTSLGSYQTEIAAAQAYDQAAILRHGQHTTAMGKSSIDAGDIVTNFPLEQYRTAFAGDAAPGSCAAQPQVALLQAKYVENVLNLCKHHKMAVNLFRKTTANDQGTPSTGEDAAPITNRILLSKALQTVDPTYTQGLAGRGGVQAVVPANQLYLLVAALAGHCQ